MSNENLGFIRLLAIDAYQQWVNGNCKDVIEDLEQYSGLEAALFVTSLVAHMNHKEVSKFMSMIEKEIRK